MNKFVLKAPYKPAGDQPQAIERLTAGIKAGHKDQVLLGVTGSGKTMTMASVIEKSQRPTLVISHNKTLAAQLAAEFQEFFPDNAVHYFVSYYDYYLPESYTPQTDTYIEKETSINEEIDRLRHAATQALLTRQDVIIVASVSCIFGLGSPEEYENAALKIKIPSPRQAQRGRQNPQPPSGSARQVRIKRKEILKKLLEMRYERNDIDLQRGTFRVRGSVLDVFPSFALDEIYRIIFKGDQITEIQILNPVTMKPLSLSPHSSQEDSIKIFPATHYVAPFDDLDEVLNHIEKDKLKTVKAFEQAGKLLEAQRLNSRVDFDLDMIRQTGYCSGIENYSRYFDGRAAGTPPYTLLDFFPANYLLLIDESHMTVPQIRGMYNGDRARKETLINFGFRLPAAYDNRPLKFEEFEAKMPQTIYVSATPGEYELRKSQITNNPPAPGLRRSGKLPKNSRSKIINSKPRDKKTNSLITNSLIHSGVVQQLIRPTGLLDPQVAVRPAQGQIDNVLVEAKKRIKKNQRVLITTLTKRMAEDLAEYLLSAGLKAYYLHSDIETLERLEILRHLRTGTYDIVVGINLLREGLDLPEVALVIILDADKEGFLRSDTALIQTMGRAARHSEGQVIMFADSLTGSMRRAIAEVNRRRKIQAAYNKTHGITPRSIQKAISAGLLGIVRHEAAAVTEDLPANIKTWPPDELRHLIKDLENQMELAAQNLEFETAVLLRDQLTALRRHLKDAVGAGQKKRGDQFARLKQLKKG